MTVMHNEQVLARSGGARYLLLPRLGESPTVSAGRAVDLPEVASSTVDLVARIGRSSPTRFSIQCFLPSGVPAAVDGGAIAAAARHLVSSGAYTPGRIEFDTPSGARWAELGHVGQVAVGLGTITWAGYSQAVVVDDSWDGLVVTTAHPHVVCMTDRPLQSIDLTHEPKVDGGRFPDGATVVIARLIDTDQLEARCIQTGRGECVSDDDAAAAAAAAYLVSDGRGSGRVTVHMPGGALRIGIAHHPHGTRATAISDVDLISEQGR